MQGQSVKPLRKERSGHLLHRAVARHQALACEGLTDHGNPEVRLGARRDAVAIAFVEHF